MLVEAPRIVPLRKLNAVIDGLPLTPTVEIPPHLVNPTGALTNERGDFMETRTAQIIASHPKVKEVIINERFLQQDQKGHDLKIIFIEESGIDPVNIQVKSRHHSILNYRNKISRKLRQLGSPMTVEEWLILDRTIVINGAREGQVMLTAFVLGVGNILKRGPEIRKSHQYIDLFS